MDRSFQVGLADVYAEQYSVEMLGGKTRTETELDKKKVALTQLFAKVMYRLDSLSHQRALAKPAKLAETPIDIAAIRIEDTMFVGREMLLLISFHVLLQSCYDL